MASAPDIDKLLGSRLAADAPLQKQIYGRLRQSIMSGTMSGGARLPSVRVLAAQLGIARNTVLAVYDQLLAEGCVEVRPGSGHYVADLAVAPARTTSSRPPRASGRSEAGVRDFGSVHANFLAAMPMRPFRPNMPAVEAGHMQSWIRCYSSVLREAGRTLKRAGFFGESDAVGERRLREAIAEHVALSRGVICSAEQIVVTSGSQHAVDLLLRVIAVPGDRAIVEDPCFLGTLAALRAAELVPVPIAVDRDGLDVERAASLGRDARVAVICPSSQYPLGHVLSMQRRLALIEWARRNDSWIIEDDYDSEFRYSGHPIPSLQGLDGGERVIYIGTFSKVLFPALRIGFIVAPEALVGPLAAARALSGRHGNGVDQEALARFILDGHLGRHIRRMRRLYRERLEALRHNCARHLGGFLELDATISGLQVVGWLPRGIDDETFSRKARAVGIELPDLSRYCIATQRPPGVLMGFGAFTEEEAESALCALATLVGGPGAAAGPPEHQL